MGCLPCRKDAVAFVGVSFAAKGVCGFVIPELRLVVRSSTHTRAQYTPLSETFDYVSKRPYYQNRTHR